MDVNDSSDWICSNSSKAGTLASEQSPSHRDKDFITEEWNFENDFILY